MGKRIFVIISVATLFLGSVVWYGCTKDSNADVKGSI